MQGLRLIKTNKSRLVQASKMLSDLVLQQGKCQDMQYEGYKHE